MSFASSFLDDTRDILEQIAADDIESVVKEIAKTRERGGRVFFCGSGGGAGHASHAACDFRKLADIEAYCVTDNVSELTARVNDEGWESSYAGWLRSSRLSAGDCLFVFSVGGGDADQGVSVNLVNAINLAHDIGASIVGIVGRDGGTLRRAASASVLIPFVQANAITAQTEGIQAIIWHLIVSHPALGANTPRWESLSR